MNHGLNWVVRLKLLGQKCSDGSWYIGFAIVRGGGRSVSDGLTKTLHWKCRGDFRH